MTAQGIQDETAFSWLVPFTLGKRDRIIAVVNSCVCKSSHKYGIEIPTYVEDAKRIDRKNEDAISK